MVSEFDSEAIQFAPDEDLSADQEDQMSEGGWMLCTSILPLAKEIWASQTTSQRLAEAHQKTVGAKIKIPQHLWDFNDVFLKESFDALLNGKVCDHVIELKPINCKVYPLSPNKQLELDAFLQENHQSGNIWPSKSPMDLQFFSSKRRMDHVKLYRTTELWMWWLSRTST